MSGNGAPERCAPIIDTVGGILTPLKNMTSSVGMMKFPIYGKMIQPTNQIIYSIFEQILFLLV